MTRKYLGSFGRLWQSSECYFIELKEVDMKNWNLFHVSGEKDNKSKVLSHFTAPLPNLIIVEHVTCDGGAWV